MESNNREIGLVLSGGGYRGMVHIGVLKLLEELDIQPTHIAGTSAGAVIGAFYAAGYSADEILDFFLNMKVLSWKNYAFRKMGFFDPQKMAAPLAEHFPDNTFAALKHRLSIIRTNLENGLEEIVESGPLIPNLMATAALPLLFAPVEIDGVLFADGGITNNFPVEPLMGKCDKIIGVYASPMQLKHKQEFKSTLSVMERALSISIASACIPKFEMCDVMLMPESEQHHSLIDIRHIRAIFEMGYAAALEQQEALLKLVD